MKFTDYLFKETKEIFDEYLKHPFLKELGQGILDKEKFKDYLIQDYLYLKQYAKVFCIGIVKSQDMDDMKFFYESVKGIMEDETDVHIKYLKNFGISRKDLENEKMNLVNSSYTSYMLGQALTGDVYDIIAAILPCTWSYDYIGHKLYTKYRDNLDNNFYKEWIESYSNEEYHELANKWIDYTNIMCENLSDSKKKKLKDIFINSCLYEMKFWNMAYKIEGK